MRRRATARNIRARLRLRPGRDQVALLPRSPPRGRPSIRCNLACSLLRSLLRPRRARRPLPAPRLHAGPRVRWWNLRGRWLRIDAIGVLIALLLKLIAQIPMPCLGCASGIFLLLAGACCHRTCAIWVARTPLRAMWRCPCSCVACCPFCFILRQLWRPSRRLHRTCPCTARCCRCGSIRSWAGWRAPCLRSCMLMRRVARRVQVPCATFLPCFCFRPLLTCRLWVHAR